MPDPILDTSPNEAAAEWLRTKARTNARVLRELLPEARARAFAVSGIEDMNRLRKVQEAIARIPEGGDWKAAREEVAAALGGAEENRARAETVVRTNAFQAYSAARYRSQMEDKEVFPYLKYVTVGDARVREAHAKLDGLVLPKGDAFWKDHYPPWDWGCRCIAVELTEGMAREEAEAGGAEVRDAEWSRQWRAAHRAADEARDFHNRPGQLTMALDEVALEENANGRLVPRYPVDDLRAFNAKMEKATVERSLPDGTVETVTVREWMWEPVREKAQARMRKASKEDPLREHAILVDRDTGEQLGMETVGDIRKTAPDWHAAKGRHVALYHSHPGFDSTISPSDLLTAMREDVHEVSASTPIDDLRIGMGDAPAPTAERAEEFAALLDAAHEKKDKAEIRRVSNEWAKLLKAWRLTGVVKVEGVL